MDVFKINDDDETMYPANVSEYLDWKLHLVAIEMRCHIIIVIIFFIPFIIIITEESWEFLFLFISKAYVRWNSGKCGYKDTTKALPCPRYYK